MDEEEQRRRAAEEARAAAERSFATIGPAYDDATAEPDAPTTLADMHPALAALPARDGGVTPDVDHSRDALMHIERGTTPGAAPVEEPTRDHMGRVDPTSGSVFGPGYSGEDQSGPADMAPGDPPDAETHYMATDADPTLPGRFQGQVFGSRRGSASPSALADRRMQSDRLGDSMAYHGAATRRASEIASSDPSVAERRASEIAAMPQDQREALLASGRSPESQAQDAALARMAAPMDDMAPGDPPDAETHYMATDADPVLPGRMRNPEPARALASPVAPPDPEREAQSAALARMAAPMSAAPSASASSSAPVAPPTTIAKPPRDPAREAEAGPARGLDYGLPTEQEISAARGNPLTDILHGLQNGLLGAAGRPLRDFGARADALAEERRSGIRAGLERKGLTRRQESQDAASAERQAQQDELAQQRLGLEERRTAATEAAVPSRIAATEALTEQRGASTEHTRTSTEDLRAETAYRSATRADLESSTSGAANAERAAIAARLSQMNASTRADTTAAIAAEGDLATMNAGDLHRIREALTAGVSLRGGGRSGTGGGAGLAALRERAVAHGVDAADAAVLPAADLRREIGEDTGPAARAAHGRAEGTRRVAILPGVYADPEIISTAPAQRALHTSITEGARHMGALRRVRAIGEQYGRTGTLDPRAEGDIVAARSTLMAMVASLENSGIIGPSDMPRIQAAVPNATDFTQANLGTLSHRLDAFEEAIDEAAAISLSAAGVTDDGMEAALRFLHTGRAGGRGSVPAPAPGDTTATPAPSTYDTSQMSDEELRALAAED